MENELDPASQDETPTVTIALEALETEATCQLSTDAEEEPTNEPQVVDEPNMTLPTQTKKPLPGKAATKLARTHEELPPNPLLLDPYEWERCTITVGYSLLPNEQVTVSVHNHKDEPIIKEFAAEEVPLPERISSVMATLQSIWTTSPVNTTVVLLPKPENALERPIIASVRVSTDTPIVQEGVESNLPFPALILSMLDELKALMPERALKNIERNSKARSEVTAKPASKAKASKAVVPASGPAVNKNIEKSQLTLF